MTTGCMGRAITRVGIITAISADASVTGRDAAAIIPGETIASRIEAIIDVPLTPAR